MRKTVKQTLALTMGLTLGLTSILSVPSLQGQVTTKAASKITTIKIEPNAHSTFHDTDGDGYGEFEGFGTSLAWWANRCGYSSSLTTSAAKLLYSQTDGLGLSIGRYNIGGGDNPSHSHITRSDSVIPGFWKNPTKVTSTTNTTNFDVYDKTSVYAWNYDWTADANQLAIAKACQKEAGSSFLLETFSNSAPYFMTVSGCTSGSKDGSTTNIKSNSYTAFSKYFTDVTKHLLTKENLNVTSVSAMNEPESCDWTAKNAKQEGCHISAGSCQSKILTSIASQLTLKGISSLILAGPDSSGTDTAYDSVKKLSTKAKKALKRIDTHAYVASEMSRLNQLARSQKKNLWMSEVDGASTAGTRAGEMSAALGFASQISSQLNTLQPCAWIMWDAIDTHIDSKNKYDANSLSNAQRIAKDTSGFWGVLIADHNNASIIKTKKYYGFGQYTRYIRPGYTIIGSGKDTVAAYDTKNHKLVIVAQNTSSSAQKIKYDLSQFGKLSSNAKVTCTRTSGSLTSGENWKELNLSKSALNTSKKSLSASLKKNSITTYVIDNIYLDSTKKNSTLKKIPVTQNFVTGKTNSSGMNGLGNLVDNNYETEYSCNKGKIIIDLGSVTKLKAISLVGSSLNVNTSKNCIIYGSNNKKKWARLTKVNATISNATPSYFWAKNFSTKQRNFRYIKIVKKTGTLGLSECKIYGKSLGRQIVTKLPKKLAKESQLPKYVKLANGKKSKVKSWSFRRTANDNMTKKQRYTILATAKLNKTLPKYGAYISKNVTVTKAFIQKNKKKITRY